MTYGICVNYAQHCPMFEVRVEAIEGDRCCECEQLLMHESGLTWEDAGEQYEQDPTLVFAVCGLNIPRKNPGWQP